jgi:hypothetical protein
MTDGRSSKSRPAPTTPAAVPTTATARHQGELSDANVYVATNCPYGRAVPSRPPVRASPRVPTLTTAVTGTGYRRRHTSGADATAARTSSHHCARADFTGTVTVARKHRTATAASNTPGGQRRQPPNRVGSADNMRTSQYRHPRPAHASLPGRTSPRPGGYGTGMQLAVSVALIVVGLIIAMVVDVARDFRLFGWILVAVGMLGLGIRAFVAGRGPGRRP